MIHHLLLEKNEQYAGVNPPKSVQIKLDYLIQQGREVVLIEQNKPDNDSHGNAYIISEIKNGVRQDLIYETRSGHGNYHRKDKDVLKAVEKSKLHPVEIKKNNFVLNGVRKSLDLILN